MNTFITIIITIAVFGIVAYLILMTATFESFLMVFWLYRNFDLIRYAYYDAQYRSFYFVIRDYKGNNIAEIEIDKSFDLFVEDFISKKRYSSFDMAPCVITKRMLLFKLMTIIPGEDLEAFNSTDSFKDRLN